MRSTKICLQIYKRIVHYRYETKSSLNKKKKESKGEFLIIQNGKQNHYPLHRCVR